MMNPQMESEHQVPSRINKDKSPLRRSMAKLQDTEDKIIKALRDKDGKREDFLQKYALYTGLNLFSIDNECQKTTEQYLQSAERKCDKNSMFCQMIIKE